MTCAPSPQTMPPSLRFASAIARDDRLEIGGGEDVRQRVDERADRCAGATAARAKSSARALLVRDFSG